MHVDVGTPKKKMRLMVSTLEGDYTMFRKSYLDSESQYDYKTSSTAVDQNKEGVEEVIVHPDGDSENWELVEDHYDKGQKVIQDEVWFNFQGLDRTVPVKFTNLEKSSQSHKIFMVKDGTIGLAPYTSNQGVPELNFMK